MLQPPTINNYTLKDSFDATNNVKSVQSDILDETDQFALFDIEFPFTNEPVNKTIIFILDQIHQLKLLKANLKKRAMEKKINRFKMLQNRVFA